MRKIFLIPIMVFVILITIFFINHSIYSNTPGVIPFDEVNEVLFMIILHQTINR